MRPAFGQYQRYKKIFAGEKMPFAFVDLEFFDRNVAYVADTQKETGKTIRIHTKSLRSVDLIKRIFKIGGPVYQGVMTYSMEETAWLAKAGLDDFIIAYPTVQPQDIVTLMKMTKAGVKVCLMVDSTEHLFILNEAGKNAGLKLNACLDLDMAYRPLHAPLHLGVRRSPVRTAQQAIAVAEASLTMPGVTINAVMGYEAHIAGLTDAVPGQRLKNRALTALKKASVNELTQRRDNIVRALKEHGLPIHIVNGGGSGSLHTTGRDPEVTEVTSGSAFFAPALFRHYRDVSFAPSAFFAIQVVRKPAPNMITCLGGGYVASGAAGADRLPVPVYPEGLSLLPMEGAGEVQTPLIGKKGAPLPGLGDPVFFQHAKAGEMTERFNELLLVDNDKIVRRVKTYRGSGKAFF